jgi:hypothetical protein
MSTSTTRDKQVMLEVAELLLLLRRKFNLVYLYYGHSARDSTVFNGEEDVSINTCKILFIFVLFFNLISLLCSFV